MVVGVVVVVVVVVVSPDVFLPVDHEGCRFYGQKVYLASGNSFPIILSSFYRMPAKRHRRDSMTSEDSSMSAEPEPGTSTSLSTPSLRKRRRPMPQNNVSLCKVV